MGFPRWHVIFYMENTKDATKNYRNEFDKVERYKIKIQKFVVFLCPNNEKINKASLFTVALKRIKYLGINLTKKTKDISLENYIALVKVTKNSTMGKRQSLQ